MTFTAQVSTGLRRGLVALGLSALLAACGGGGGGGGGSDPAAALEAPPTSAAALQGSASSASGAAAAALASAERLVQISASLDGGFVPLGNGLGSPAAWSRTALLRRESALATETVPCSSFFGTTACSGSITVDTNASGNATVLPAGTYVTLTFNALQGTVEGSPVAFNGVMRIDYLTTFDLNAVSLAGLRFQLALTALSGTADGVSFGPFTETALFEFDAQGVSSITIDGLRIGGLDNLLITDADDFSLAGVTLRRAHWEQLAGYIDVSFIDWRVVAGRPAVNSAANIEVPGSRIGVIVRASSPSQVVYEVNCLINGAISNYSVTATYPPGGGAPTYTVVPA
jgi:hypothetical protein